MGETIGSIGMMGLLDMSPKERYRIVNSLQAQERCRIQGDRRFPRMTPQEKVVRFLEDERADPKVT